MGPTPNPAADPPLAAWLRRGALAALCLVGWMLADLWVGRDLLPFAPTLEHLAFRAVVGPLEWLTEGDGGRLVGAGATWLGLSVLAGIVRGRAGAVALRGNALLLCGGLVFVAVLGLLMERALAGGIGVALAVRVLGGRLLLAPGLPHRGVPAARAPLLALLVVAGGGALYWLYAVFMTFGEGYPLLRWLGGLLRTASVPFVAVWAGLAGLLLVAATVWLARIAPLRPRRGVFALATVAGVLATAVVRWGLGAEGPASSAALLVPLALVITELAAGPWGLTRAAGSLDPAGWPRRALLPALLGALLVSHAYAARVLACPDEGAMPFLRRVAAPPEIFRIAPGAGGLLALSGRGARSLGWLDPATGTLGTFGAGPLAAPFPPGVPPDGSMNGNPEELVWSAVDGAWVASIVPADPFAFMEPGAPPGTEVNNLLATVDPSARAITRVAAYPGMCWINTLHAQPDGLWVGCEDRPGLARLEGGAVAQETAAPALGDVQDLAFGSGGRVWSISLWFRPTLTELRRHDLSIARQLRIGGTHYHLAHDPVTDRLFASAWYGSRLRVVDAGTMTAAGSLPLGFGGRAVSVDARRRLVLASSTYDGLLRVCDPDALTVRAALPVGGHIKDIAVDEELGRAWFWSQCGLYELDLDGLVAWLDRDGPGD
jgi:hypothetical protein